MIVGVSPETYLPTHEIKMTPLALLISQTRESTVWERILKTEYGEVIDGKF